MFELILIGLIGGLVTGLSPCILPVLPVVFLAGGAAAPPVPTRGAVTDVSLNQTESGGVATMAPPAPPRTRSGRPFKVIAGLVVSFSFFTLLGTAILTALHLPQDLLRTVGIVILAVVGLGLLVPKLGEWLERPFARLPKRQVNRDGSAFILGLGLGLLFVPCAGPVLTAITVLSATNRLDLGVVALTLSFAIGVAIPLLAFALAGERVSQRVRAFRTHASTVRKVAGVFMILLALLTATNALAGLQRLVPGYAESLQSQIEDNGAVQSRLDALTGRGASELAKCDESSDALVNCGAAPGFTGIKQWLNTDDGKAIDLAQQRGKVVLVDFWTYSCINCQRTLPAIESWHQRYQDSGLVVVGVHTPEFAFEREVANVAASAKRLGVTYPIAIDNGYSTWSAYDNRFWPARYLIDADGQVRSVHLGEGAYNRTENQIRQLLTDADPRAQLPTSGSDVTVIPVADRSPETYLGYNRIANVVNDPIVRSRESDYTSPTTLAQDQFAFSGRWTVAPQKAVAGSKASIEMNFRGKDVYAVISGSGQVKVSVDGGAPRTVQVSGTPRLYPLVTGHADGAGDLRLDVGAGLQLFTLTFG